MMTTQKKLMTAEEFMALDREGRFELIRGELVEMTPPAPEHGEVSGEAYGHLWQYVKAHKLGTVFTEINYLLKRNPDIVRAPDVSFIVRDRVPRPLPRRAFDIPPDLAIEVLSPGDRRTEVEGKVQDWLAFGAHLVWLINSQRRTVTVYRRGIEPRVLTEADTLDGEDVAPGFRCPVAELFPED